MKLSYCPSCGQKSAHIGIWDDPHMCYCECGMVWRNFAPIQQITMSELELTWKDLSKNEKIREALEDTIVAYLTKNEDTNKERLNARKKTIDWLASEIYKGPIEGGTMADIPYETERFGQYIWEALQKAILIRDPVCRICNTRPSKEVHHIRPKHLQGKNHPRNLVGLCLECHDEVHRKIGEGIQNILESSLSISVVKYQTTLDEARE